MTQSFGTVHKGPINPPDPNSPEDYQQAILDSLWAFKTGMMQ